MTESTQDQQGNPFEGPDADSSSETFFNSLDDNLGTREIPTPEPEQVTSQEVIPDEAGEQGNENNVNADTDWQKRYNDSSIEARRLKAENDELQPFKSVINFLKEDSGAVDVLQNYLKNGGEVPQNVQEELKLDDDFMFDMDDATKDPDSDSGKLLNRMVEKKAQSIVDNTLQQERQKTIQAQQQAKQKEARKVFMEKRGYTEEQMDDLENRAKQQVMTYEDMDLLLNKDRINQNVHQNAQKEVMNQMNAVRNIPTSIGGTNSTGAGLSSEEQFFNDVFGDQTVQDDNPF